MNDKELIALVTLGVNKVYWRPYVSVAWQRANAQPRTSKLRKQGLDVCAVEMEGLAIACIVNEKSGQTPYASSKAGKSL